MQQQKLPVLRVGQVVVLLLALPQVVRRVVQQLARPLVQPQAAQQRLVRQLAA